MDGGSNGGEPTGYPSGSTSLSAELPPGTEKSLGDITLLKGQDEATLRQLEEAARWYFGPEGEQIFDRTDTSDDV